MSHRLSEAYNKLEQENRSAFLENNLELDQMWGKEVFGVFLQVDLAENIQDVLHRYQQELDQLEPGNLLLPPRNAQHVSVNQVIFWNGTYELGGQKTWQNIQDEFLDGMRTFNQNVKSFDITFSKLIATRNAIVFAAYDQDDEFQHLRSTLHEQLPFPKETTKFNNIIHTTVARFKNKLNDPGKVVSFLKQQTDLATMRVQTINLREELVFPSLKTKNIMQISLN